MTSQVTPAPGSVPVQFPVNRVKIISVYPIEMRYDVRGGPINKPAANTRFTLPAAPRNGYTEIEVEDMVEIITTFIDQEEGVTRAPGPKPARIVADSLVNAWTSGILGAKDGGRPGIAIRDESVPLEDQLEQLRAIQTVFADTLITEASQFFFNHDFTSITGVHRKLAEWRGVDVPWIAPSTMVGDKKPCPACTQQIPMQATVCPKCLTNLVQWYEDYGVTPENDPVVAMRMEAKRAAAARAAAAGVDAPKPAAPAKPSVAPPITVKPNLTK